MIVLILAVGFTLVVSFFCSLSEASLLSLSHAQAESLSARPAGKILKRFKQEIDAPIAAILILNTVANTIGAAFAGGTYLVVFGGDTLWLFSLGFTGAILLISEIVPKTLGVAFAPRVAVPVAHMVSVLIVILRPLIFLTHAVSNLVRGDTKAPSTSIDEIRLLAALGHAEGAVTRRAADIIDGAATLKELTAYDVMLPRTGVAFLSGQRSLAENLEIIRTSGHSRFPFAPAGDLDHVQGVVLAKELLFSATDPVAREDLTAGRGYNQLVRAVSFVPGTMPLERLLRIFQEEHRHLAVVVDEYGGTEGIVTLEDVLEEIVGEIMDESDRVDSFIVRRSKHGMVCRGGAEVRKVFELLGVTDDTQTVTLSGLLAEQVGRVPRVGDVVLLHGHSFSVLRASARRAERIEIRPQEDAPEAGESVRS